MNELGINDNFGRKLTWKCYLSKSNATKNLFKKQIASLFIDSSTLDLCQSQRVKWWINRLFLCPICLNSFSKLSCKNTQWHNNNSYSVGETSQFSKCFKSKLFYWKQQKPLRNGLDTDIKTKLRLPSKMASTKKYK